jgi:hypothetical protein
MLGTVCKAVIVVWMLQMVLHFGGSTLPVVLVISLTALALRLIICPPSFTSDRLRDSAKTGRFNSPVAEPFAGISKINSSFRNRI